MNHRPLLLPATLLLAAVTTAQTPQLEDPGPFGRGKKPPRAAFTPGVLPSAGARLEVPPAPAKEGCTVGVISGRATADGRPLLWKNRDIKRRPNKVLRFPGRNLPFLGLVSANPQERANVWAGINAAGFAIMNSASNDLPGEGGDREGRVMKRALGTCRSLADFEKLLEATAGEGRGVKANFGVIDARGGAVLFETSSHHHRRFDANDREEAPLGFIVRANCALTGRGKGSGFGRYERARRLFARAVREKKLDRDFLLGTVCRDLFTFARDPYPLGRKGEPPIDTATTISRRTTVSASLFHGVVPGQDPRRACWWLVLGHPAAAPAVPLFVAAGEVPAPLTAPPGEGAPLWLEAEKLFELLCAERKGAGFLRPELLAGAGILPGLVADELANRREADALLRRLPGRKLSAPARAARLAEVQERCAARAAAAVKEELGRLGGKGKRKKKSL